jgi:hypothetical protein
MATEPSELHPHAKLVRLVKKSDSRFMRFLGRIVFWNERFMSDYWTTIGTTIYVPTRHNADFDAEGLDGLSKHASIIHHEMEHVEQYRRLGPLFFVLYLGPAPFLFVLAGLLALLAPPVFAWIALALAGLTLPLSIGLAYGRWWLERGPWLNQMARNLRSGATPPETDREQQRLSQRVHTLAEDAAEKLWLDYAWTWPRGLAYRWFVENFSAASPTRLSFASAEKDQS